MIYSGHGHCLFKEKQVLERRNAYGAQFLFLHCSAKLIKTDSSMSVAVRSSLLVKVRTHVFLSARRARKLDRKPSGEDDKQEVFWKSQKR